jgi:hypothetical protein
VPNFGDIVKQNGRGGESDKRMKVEDYHVDRESNDCAGVDTVTEQALFYTESGRQVDGIGTALNLCQKDQSSDDSSNNTRVGLSDASSCMTARQGEFVLNMCSTKQVQSSDPHWSRLNVNHALFDLASLALVLKDMPVTPEMTPALLESARERISHNDSKSVTDGSREDSQQKSQTHLLPEITSKVDLENTASHLGFRTGNLDLEKCNLKDATAVETKAKPVAEPCMCKVCAGHEISSCQELLEQVTQTLKQFDVDETWFTC